MENNRSGIFRKNLSGDASYLSFVPNSLPPNPPLIFTEEIIENLIEAHQKIAILESVSARIPNMELFVGMNVRKEALMSSQIEGTQATLEDILDPEIENNTNRNIGEVLSYIKAINYGIDRMRHLPLGNRFIKEVHEILMQSSRGHEKNKDEFRRTQNWFGDQGAMLKHAQFIPPNPKDMLDAMSDLETYMNTGSSLDVLIRAGLIHYQFETIHPFLDGNGRMGRLLIIFYLLNQRTITTPALYISYYLKKNRLEYYDGLNQVRRKGDYEQWLAFFLKAISISAEDSANIIKRLADLHDVNIARIDKFGRSRITTREVFAYLESNPIIEITRTADALNLSYNTVLKAVERLIDLSILNEVSGKRRNRVFTYSSYLDVLREGTEN